MTWIKKKVNFRCKKERQDPTPKRNLEKNITEFPEFKGPYGKLVREGM